MMTAKGAAAMNQSSQLMVVPSCFSMKPRATMFWAAAVLMPTFQMLSAWAMAIIITAEKRLFSGTPKAEMMPMTIGTMQETRAVVLGTKKLRIKPTRITPARILLVLAPILDRTNRAMRLSSPVFIMAAAIKRAAPTSARAVLEKPLRASLRAPEVPSILSGLFMLGAVPSRNAIRVMMMDAETG